MYNNHFDLNYLWAGLSGVPIPAGRRDFFFSHQNRPDHLWDPSSLLFNGHRDYLSRVKWSEREFVHSPPLTVEVKKEWS